MSIEAEAVGDAAVRREHARNGWAGALAGRRPRASAAPIILAALAALTAAVGAILLVGEFSGASLPSGALVTAIGLSTCAVTLAAAGLTAAMLAGRPAIMRRALDALPEAVLITAADGRLVYANAAFKHLFPVGMTRPLDAIARAAADPATATDLGRLHHGGAAPAEASRAVIIADAGGASPRQLDVSVRPLAGRLGCSLWRLRECAPAPLAPATDDAQNPRRAAGEPDRRFFADAPVGIAVLDRSGRFVEANRTLGELFGALPEQLVGCELIGWLNQSDRAAIAAKFGATADAQIDREPVEVRLAGPGERTMVLLFSRKEDLSSVASVPCIGVPEAARMSDCSGDYPRGGLTLYFIDVTEQKSLEAQFAQSQKMQAVGQLAGGVAHDFNNLLTAMIGFCDLLLLRSRPADPAFADIMQIKQNANRAANLVRQLLAFSRQQTLQPRVLDVTDVLVELSHLLRRLIGEDISLDVVHGRDLGLVKVDQGQLEQVVINLAVNARDAMAKGGRLTIRTANLHQASELRRGPEIVPAGDYVQIEVADTGIGIPAADLVRIFEPFFSTKEVGSGTGLGLSTVYGIVKQTGGFVFVESAPGQGTIFQIYLPRHQAAPGTPPVRATAAEPAGPRDLTGTAAVMLVEDDDAVRMFGARALRNKGYCVTEAKSGEAALELIGSTTEKFDLLITDVVMPQMDGPELIREVRQIDPGIKIIFISGYTEDAFRQRLDSDSNIHFLAKPFSLKQLAVKVKDVIGTGSY